MTYLFEVCHHFFFRHGVFFGGDFVEQIRLADFVRFLLEPRADAFLEGLG